MADTVLFVVGVSGAGKTAAVEWLEARSDFRGVCRFFDSIEVPTPEEMVRSFGSPEAWQESATDSWIRALVEHPASLVVLEGQTRLSFIRDAARRHGLNRMKIVLLECSSEVRRSRLEMRNQPDLASERMERWAAYLRGQADALGIPVIDTSELTVAEVGAELRDHARQFSSTCDLTGDRDLTGLKLRLQTADLDGTIHFYRDVLGLQVVDRWSDEDDAGVIFGLGGVSGTASLEFGQVPSPDNGAASVQLRVADMASFLARLGDSWEVDEDHHRPWGSVYSYLTDPNGVRVIVHSGTD